MIIPVIDLMGGLVVRGIAGDRDHYRPIQSQLCRTANPGDVADSILRTFTPDWLYVADLDAIRGGSLQVSTLREILKSQASICLDAGTATPETALRVLNLGVERAVIGLESLGDLDALSSLVTTCGTERLIFSLDLRGGTPCGTAAQQRSAFDIANTVICAGITHLIVLDLHGVGTGLGVPTAPLCKQLRLAFPDVRLWTGGGVRDAADVRLLADMGVDGVLVASALHDGRILPADLLGNDPERA